MLKASIVINQNTSYFVDKDLSLLVYCQIFDEELSKTGLAWRQTGLASLHILYKRLV